MVKYSEQNLDLIFGALSDPTRRKILEKLSSDELMVTEIASDFAISLPAVSKHLKVLEKAGIINRSKEGKVHKISVRKDSMDDAWKWIEQNKVIWEKRFDSLDKYLNEESKKGG